MNIKTAFLWLCQILTTLLSYFNLVVMFNHYFVEGLKNLIRSFWLSITAIFIITVSLMSVTLASSLWLITGFTLRQLDNQAIIYVYLKDGTSNESKNIILKLIRRLKTWHLLTKLKLRVNSKTILF